MAISEGNLSAADVAAVTRNNCGYGGMGGMGGMGWGGEGMWWIIILFVLAALFGNGFGFGGMGGGFGGAGGGAHFVGAPWATQADVRAAVDQQTLISKLDQQTYGLADATYALNNTITNGFAQAELSRCNQQAALMAQLCAMQADAAKCCCETQRLVERGFAETNYNMATQFCESRHQAEKNTRDIIDNANCNTRAILDFLTQSKIDTLRDENQALRFAASQSAQNAFITANQEAQTAELLRRLGRDCPTAAYLVPNPNCCYQPIQFSSGCGCGNNGGYAYA